MSKHEYLTIEEMESYHPGSDLVNIIESYRKRENISPSKMNILDWGCGRGETVLWLRWQGYNAFGIDIDPEPINNGLPLFGNHGYPKNILSLIGKNNKTDIQNDQFHFVFSNQVIEHVKDIGTFLYEIWRITKVGGIGLHIFPARRHLIEAHLKMPFIHWLPKNIIRKLIIYIFVLLKIDPNWEELNGQPIKRKADHYYNYSINKTFYRSYNELRKLFKAKGFECSKNYRFDNKHNNFLFFIGNTLRNLFLTTKLRIRKI